MKTSKILITLVSMAAIGLSSAAAQEQRGEGSGDAPRMEGPAHDWGQLREMKQGLWEAQKAIIKARHAILSEHREEYAALYESWQGVKDLPEDNEERIAVLEDLKLAREELRAECEAVLGEQRTELRKAHRDLMRQMREMKRERRRELIDDEGVDETPEG